LASLQRGVNLASPGARTREVGPITQTEPRLNTTTEYEKAAPGDGNATSKSATAPGSQRRSAGSRRVSHRCRSAIVHIGAEKTGSEAIRQLLARNRRVLPDLGFWYPLSPGSTNHFGLALYSAPGNMPGLEAHVPAALRNGGFDENLFAQQLKDEIAGLPAAVDTVIFSNEHCHSRVIEQRQVQRLYDLLSEHFESITILVYLRRQDEMARSVYSTRLRFGDASFDILPPTMLPTEPFPRYFDIEHLLDRYAAVFGKDAVKARVYERDFLENGDVVDDFLKVCGLPAWLGSKAPQPNRALSAEGLAFLALLNERSDQDPRSSAKIRDICLPIIENNLRGPTLLPAREEAKRFYDGFGAMNARVRASWFPERESLFSNDFSQYPETADNSEVSRYQRAMRAALVIIDSLIEDKAAEKERLTTPARKRMFALGQRWRQREAVDK